MGKNTASGGAAARRASRHSEPTPSDKTNAAAASTPASDSLRRTGRNATPVVDSEISDKIQSGAKTAPARSRRPSSTPDAGASGSKALATTGGQKRSRLARASGPVNGSESRSLRKRGSVSFRETSDDEDDEDRSSSESEPEIIDDTIYEVPAEAILPEVTVLDLPNLAPPVSAPPVSAPVAAEAVTGEEAMDIAVAPPLAPSPVAAPVPAPSAPQQQLVLPTAAMGELTAAYALLRSFSWQLRLAPFSFEDFCAAMSAVHPTVLMDEIHVCVLRALAFDEVQEEREERKLDLGMLDALTWPCYVWEMLRLTADPLAKYEWSQRLLDSIVPTTVVTANAVPSITPAPEQPRQITITPAAVVSSAEDGDGQVKAKNEAQPMEMDVAAPAVVMAGSPSSGRVEGGVAAMEPVAPASVAPAVAAAVPSPLPQPTSQSQSPLHPRPRAFEPVDIAQMDQQLAAAPTTEAAAAIQMFSSCAPAVHQRQTEYYSLPLETKAAILSRLCDHLLDCTTFRAEIDRREEENLFVGGRGDDEGGFFTRFPIAERERIAKTLRAGKGDSLPPPDTEACVICGVGGSLHLCDGCPAAFHQRCIGERSTTTDGSKKKGGAPPDEPKEKPEEPWYCPECILGGRGETAGVRIPVAARNKWKQPLHIINGAVVCTQLPAVQSQGRHLKELSATAPVTVLTGPAAAEALAASRKVRDTDEFPFPSSFETVKSPPQDLPVNRLPDGTLPPPPPTGPEAYTNKYRNAWTASSIALRATIDECKRKKTKGKLTIPTGTCGRLIVSELPEQMPLSKFQWFQMQGRPGARTTTRCGKCHTCLKTSLRKGCMNPVVRPLEDVLSSTYSPDSSKLSYLVAYVCKVEREFWAVIEGPWASELGGGMQFRAQWSTSVRNASTVSDLAQSLLQLESLIRPVAFDPSWFGKSGTSGGISGGGSSSQPGSRGISRSGSMMDVQGGSAGAGPSSQPQQATAGGDDGDDGSGTKNKSTGDPYDIRTEKVVKAEWEMNRRSHAAHVASVNRLPLSLLKKAARHGGRQPIPGVQYKKKEWKLVSPRLAWIAEMEAVQTCAQLALAIRKLDAVLNWEGIVKPKGLAFDAPFANAAVQAKRPVGSSGSSPSTCEYEYLIDMRQPMNPKEQEMFQKQQQALATIFQQRMAGAEAQVLMAQKQQQQQQQPQIQHPGGPLAGVSPAFLAGANAAANAAAAVAAAGAPGRLGSLNTGFVAPPIVPPFAGAVLPPRPPLSALPKQEEQAAPAAGNALPVPMVATAAAATAAAQQQQLFASGLPLPGPFLPAGFPAFAVPPMVPMAPAMPMAITMAQPPLPGLVTAPAVPAPVAAVAPFVVKKPAELTEEQKISRQIVETAIKKAIEADLLHMPAAMAAKFRRKQSVGGDSTTEFGAPAAAEDTKPTRTTAPAAGVFPPGMMPFFGAPGLFARPPMFGPPPPTWIHEREIPLWYIRSYEELCRREAANVAARELQAAARRGSTMDGAIKDAARKAAQVAAQAAADACGICYAAQGDNPELDALWICCDTCNRWFHGACVAMEPEDVNTISEDEQWDCPGCANARRKAERAARREGKTLPSTFSPMEADAAAKKSGGRASKPFYEYADYKAGEAKMLEKLRRGEPIDGSGSRGKKRSVGGGYGAVAGETAEEATNRLAARTEYKKRKREEEARLAAEPIHCPVCQYPDFGRALVECDACHRWFHYECVGTAVDEVEAAMADEQQLRCAECQGKRVRPPTQAAIDAAILAAADMKSGRKRMRDDSVQPVPLSELAGAGGGGGGLPGLFQQGVASPAPEVISQGPGGRSFNWRDAVNKIVVKTMRLGVAGPFCRPVSLEDAPDYNEFVKQPMDLDTLHSAIPRLRSPLDVLAGVNLVVDNCILYNGEGSDFAAAAVDMQRSFLKLWGAKGMPLTTEQWEAMLAGESSRPPRAAPNSGGAGGSGGGAGPSGPGRKSTGGGGVSARKKSSFAASLAALSPAPNAHPAYDWRLCAAKALKQLAKLEVAEPFLEPVPFDVEDYHDVITNPMDIGTIQQRLSKGLYSDPSEVAADIAQIWTNCRTFNEPKAPIVADAAEAEEAFIQFWIAEEVYESDPRASGGNMAPLPSSGVPGSGNAFRPTGPAAGASGSKPPPSAPHMTIVPDWQEAARKVLYRMINFTTSATWFITPVAAEDVPDYHQIIKSPMDLSTVLEKIKSGEYATPDEVVADVELIWKNAAAYNGLDHPVTKAAAQAREAFIKLWNTAGLDPEGQQQRLQMLEQRQQQIRQTQEQARLARQQSLAAAAASGRSGGGGGNASASAPLYDTQQDWVSAVRRVLSGIMNTTSCAPFNGPVSNDAHPEYSHLIEVHMDFGQILRNLGRGRYGNAVQAMQDIRLLLNNWRIYGEQTGDDTYATAGLEVAKLLFQAWQGEQLPVK